MVAPMLKTWGYSLPSLRDFVGIIGTLLGSLRTSDLKASWQLALRGEADGMRAVGQCLDRFPAEGFARGRLLRKRPGFF
jgi:hypothetical protein